MDVTNRIVNSNINIYGLCDKQLACTTCRVDLQSHYDKVPPPSEEEIDVLITTKNYQDESSRMACQVVISEDM
jgi:2Fe-2S ferredoxin